MNKKIKTLVTSLMLLFSSLALHAENEIGNGGDLIRARTTWVTEIVLSALGDDLLKSIDLINPDMIKGNKEKKLYMNLLNAGLKEDIVASSPYYYVETPCLDKNGISQAEVSVINEKGGAICFDAKKIAQDMTSKSDLFGIALHAHAHHLGEEDSDMLDLLTIQFSQAHQIVDVNREIERIRLRKDPNRWNDESPAHAGIRGALRVMENRDLDATYLIKELSCFGGSGRFREKIVLGYAHELHSKLARLFGAKRKEDRSQSSSQIVHKVVSLLYEGRGGGLFKRTPQRNLRWLADQLDSLYRFDGEEEFKHE